MRSAAVLLALLLCAPPAGAMMHEARIPLHDHKLREEDLTAALCRSLRLPAIGYGSMSIDLSSLQGCDFVDALNAAMADGGHVALDNDQLVLDVDPHKLPHNMDAIKHAIEVFTAVAAPNATANQRRTYGLSLPVHVDPTAPMVVLVHGLDCNRSNWYAMADLLASNGYQVAYFCYPSDGPIADSAALFAKHMRAVRETYPDMPLDIVAHSMGGLVARAYVEGDDYAGNVKHLILLGTPNMGSRWAEYRIALEWQEHLNLRRHDPHWSPTWMITDGLGEAGHDLKPTSAFLRDLNAHPRRAGVAYTIVAGNQNPIGPMAASAIDRVANVAPKRIANWWGIRQTEHFLHKEAVNVADHAFKSDGPVAVKSTRLAGVDDYVVVPADHNALYLPNGSNPPAAWPIVRDRLTH
jgi:pimeloyl-ACP methyl ester carboxylesterase